jgi:hypothetical protein
MKHNKDLSGNVMKKVVQYEEHTTRVWTIVFISVLGILTVTLISSIYFIYQDFIEFQTFALFSLFAEDWEIISEYWRDTLLIVWEESPQPLIILGLCVCAIIVVYLFLTGRKRKLLQKKMEQVEKYRKRLRP